MSIFESFKMMDPVINKLSKIFQVINQFGLDPTNDMLDFSKESVVKIEENLKQVVQAEKKNDKSLFRNLIGSLAGGVSKFSQHSLVLLRVLVQVAAISLMGTPKTDDLLKALVDIQDNIITPRRRSEKEIVDTAYILDELKEKELEQFFSDITLLYNNLLNRLDLDKDNFRQIGSEEDTNQKIAIQAIMYIIADIFISYKNKIEQRGYEVGDKKEYYFNGLNKIFGFNVGIHEYKDNFFAEDTEEYKKVQSKIKEIFASSEIKVIQEYVGDTRLLEHAEVILGYDVFLVMEEKELIKSAVEYFSDKEEGQLRWTKMLEFIKPEYWNPDISILDRHAYIEEIKKNLNSLPKQ